MNMDVYTQIYMMQYMYTYIKFDKYLLSYDEYKCGEELYKFKDKIIFSFQGSLQGEMRHFCVWVVSGSQCFGSGSPSVACGPGVLASFVHHYKFNFMCTIMAQLYHKHHGSRLSDL